MSWDLSEDRFPDIGPQVSDILQHNMLHNVVIREVVMSFRYGAAGVGSCGR